jgi:ABC-type proline/glycine betaine transport system substrate-binding protein
MKMWIGVTQKYMNKTVAEKKLKASEERSSGFAMQAPVVASVLVRRRLYLKTLNQEMANLLT